MTNGERIEAKLDWLVVAVKHLLAVEAGVELPAADELEDWMDDDGGPHVYGESRPVLPTEMHTDMSQFEHLAVRSRPQPKRPACPHNQQVLVDGNVACARCGFVLSSSGLVRSTVSASGQIQNDPNPPAWALERSPGASSKNPGGPLVPY